MKYATLVEQNDWEGETWYFHFPCEDEDLLHEINTFLTNTDYSIQGGFWTEEEVDKICDRLSRTTYMKEHNKLGEVDFTPLFACKEVEEIDELLYKGGIMRLQKGS